MDAVLARLTPRMRTLTRGEYDALVDTGAFDGQRLELIHGVIVTMSPQKAPHASVVQVLAKKLMPLALAGRAEVRVQLPFLAGDDSEPEPDVAVVPTGRYTTSHPDRAALLVEVGDSTVDDDRAIKGPLYASTGVPEFWLVNIPDRSVEVYSRPLNGQYADKRTLGLGDALTPAAFPDVVIPVGDILP